jgi:hypothetical protein
VLKITFTETPTERRWVVHGRLAGPWAAELGLTWRDARRESDTRRCIVELNNVTFIDRNGEAVLMELMSQGAEFIARGLYTKELIGNLHSVAKAKSDEERKGR